MLATADCTERYLDVLPRVSEFLDLSEFSASISVNSQVLQCASHGDIMYVQPAAVHAMAAAHSLGSEASEANVVRITLLSLLNIDLHVRASSGLVLRNSLLHTLRALRRAVRLRIHLVGPRLDVLLQSLLQCGHGWEELTHLELHVEEGRFTFPCSRDILPWQCTLASLKNVFARKPWPCLQRVVLTGSWECPRCVKWSAGLGCEDVQDEVLSRSSLSLVWTFPVD